MVARCLQRLAKGYELKKIYRKGCLIAALLKKKKGIKRGSKGKVNLWVFSKVSRYSFPIFLSFINFCHCVIFCVNRYCYFTVLLFCVWLTVLSFVLCWLFVFMYYLCWYFCVNRYCYLLCCYFTCESPCCILCCVVLCWLVVLRLFLFLSFSFLLTVFLVHCSLVRGPFTLIFSFYLSRTSKRQNMNRILLCIVVKLKFTRFYSKFLFFFFFF